MDEDIICIGCGAVLQSDDPQKAGYLPKSALEKAKNEENTDVYCQRCFKLRHYNEIMPVDLNNDDLLALLNSLAEKKALIVNVVDLFDFSNSLLSSLKRFVGNNDFILVGNKFDLFPKNSKQSKIKDWMRQEANRMGLYPKDIFLVSAKKKLNLDKRLLEFDFGDWDGKKMDDIVKEYPDVVDPWGKINRDYIKYAKNGESYEDFDKRCGDFLDEMYQKYPDKRVLVVAHGRLIRIIAAHYLTNGDMDKIDTMNNCALAKFSVKKKIARMIFYNRLLA